MENLKEIWKDVLGFEGKYQVSNLGNIKSLRRVKERNKMGKVVIPEKVLSPHVDKVGYKRLYLYNDGFKKRDLLHRIVAKTFIPNPENKPEVNHKNGIKTDNRVENLEWATTSENRIHAFENKLQIAIKGSKLPQSILKEEDIIAIRELWDKRKYLQKEIAQMYNVSKSCIYQIVYKKNWRHV
jgi:hypothetical protein